MKLSAYLDYSNGQYECTLCERYFSHEAALYDHCRQTSRHAWCERCSRVFLSTSAKDAHLRESNAHHICSSCPRLPDFETDKELEDHLVECHHYCPNCDIYCNSEKQLEEHDVEKHCLCPKCGNFFTSRNNLQMVQWHWNKWNPALFSESIILTTPQHQQKHEPRNRECYGCYQTFKTFSGMLIHLESGNCTSEVTKDEIDDIARECFQSHNYTDDDPEDGGWIYVCPNCDKEFPNLSALYQHVEDVTLCSHVIKGYGCLAKLERFIARSLK